MSKAIQLVEGGHVKYVDEVGYVHDALITAAWGARELVDEQAGPAINIVFVLQDPNRRDQYGQQKDHRSSCVHWRHQSAPGNYWYHPAEGDVPSLKK